MAERTIKLNYIFSVNSSVTTKEVALACIPSSSKPMLKKIWCGAH